MDLEGIMLSDMSDRKINTVCCCLYVEPKKYNKCEYNIKEADSQI